jgi:hypothetical protein
MSKRDKTNYASLEAKVVFKNTGDVFMSSRGCASGTCGRTTITAPKQENQKGTVRLADFLSNNKIA